MIVSGLGRDEATGIERPFNVVNDEASQFPAQPIVFAAKPGNWSGRRWGGAASGVNCYKGDGGVVGYKLVIVPSTKSLGSM